MPGKIKVKVLAGRNLPVMDRASDTTDAFVEVKFGGVTHKTDVCRKSLNPHWSSTEWYRFEVDESELQDEPLQLRLMDHDTYSANDAIGKVVISLAPLLAREANNVKGAGPQGAAVMSGWIPVFDTMHGIRGELNIIVKVELFSDFNKYKTSSCGVQFFHCPTIPPGYRATSIHGFVEELVVNDDPEYQWIDKIRTPRASNEARQVAFIKLSNQVQRLVGLKAAELGANAVVGYQQDFDLEGEAGVVARAIGTAVSITALPTLSQPVNLPPCTQQQLRHYLDILATDDETITDLNQYYQTHREELQKMLNILNPRTPSIFDDTENLDDDVKTVLTRQSSVKSYAGSISIYQDDYSQNSLKHLSEDQTELNKLLNKTEQRSGSDSSGTIQKIKKIKTNFFTKRLSSIRARSQKRKNKKEEDQVSIKSNSSDTSRLSEIKNEFKKLKRLKKPKFHKAFVNNADEGVGMVSILARSVIHAHTSLACIAESQDAENSPSSTIRRPSESEPAINLSDDNELKTDHKSEADKILLNATKSKIPEIHFTSLNNVSEDMPEMRRRQSLSCPSTPVANRNDNTLVANKADYYSSLSSALSGESSEIDSSSDDDEDSIEMKTDTDKSLETTSSVVQTVMKKNATDAVDKKASIIEELTPGVDSIIQKQIESSSGESKSKSSNPVLEDKNEKELISIIQNLPDVQRPVAKRSNSHHFKFHNPFAHKKNSKSMSAPSSPVEKTGFLYRSSNKIISQFSRLSKSNLIKSLSHISLIPKKKKTQPTNNVSEPSSSSGVMSKVPSDTVLGSPFLSYTDLLSLDKDGVELSKLYKSDDPGQTKVKMYIGSEPVSRASVSGPSSPYSLKDEGHFHDQRTLRNEKLVVKPAGLVHTAMETILMDKVQSLLLPASPDPIQTKEQCFFYDVNERLEKVEEARYQDDKHKTSNVDRSSGGLLHTAMETMLMDKMQALLPFTSDPIIEIESKKKEVDKPHDEATESVGLVHSALKTILIDKMESLLPTEEDKVGKFEMNQCHEAKNQVMFGKEDENVAIKSVDQINTVIDKFHSSQLTPPEIEVKEISEHKEVDERNNTIVTCNEKNNKPPGLIQTSMQTVLIDKVKALLPTNDSGETFSSPIETFDKTDTQSITEKTQHDDVKPSGLIQSAMQTILIDKMQSLLPANTEIDTKELKTDSKPISTHENVEEPKGLFRSAMEAMLFENVQTLLVTPTVPENIDNDVNESQKTNQNKFESAKDSTETKRKLVRQNSVDKDDDEPKMSKDNVFIPCKVSKTPVLQHFHPILSGAPLETIPSLPETSFDQTESIDVEGVDTNIASLCDNSHAACHSDRVEREKEKKDGSPRHSRHESCGGREPPSVPSSGQNQNSSVNATSTPLGIHRRSSDSDLSITPKGGSLNTSAANIGSGGGAILRPSMNSNNLDMLEYPFLTMNEFPPGFIVHIGGTVCARSVKLVDAGGAGEGGVRAAWWAELRTELRAHARALRCNAVIAYTDTAAICEDVCVLSASGTAAVINLDCDYNVDIDALPNLNGSKNKIEEFETDWCSVCHVPYSPGAGPYRAELATCGGCRRARVPTVLLATCAKPFALETYGKAIALTAVAARVRRLPPSSEPGARDISDQLPFLEYELHKLLLAKLRMQGANALFNLRTQVAVGERCVMALASGAAVRLAALPEPSPPKIKASESDKSALELQKAIWDTFNANKIENGYDVVTAPPAALLGSGSGAPPLELCADKEACVLELDEAEDVVLARALAASRRQASLVTSAGGLQHHAFAQVWRGRLSLSPAVGGGLAAGGERHVSRALSTVVYKLRRLQPALIAPALQLQLTEDEIQLVVSGAAVSMTETKQEAIATDKQAGHHGNEDDDIFALDEEGLVKPEVVEEKIVGGQQSPNTVTLTSAHSCGPGTTRRVCALRLLFVRETTAVRELGGLSGFLHTFTCEVMAIARAYTAALGGNALTSFYITQLMLQDNAHKNQVRPNIARQERGSNTRPWPGHKFCRALEDNPAAAHACRAIFGRTLRYHLNSF